MATLQEQINELTTRLNNIEQNSKNIEDLATQSPIVLASVFMLRNGGNSEKLTLQAFSDLINGIRIIEIDGPLFLLWKHPDNNIPGDEATLQAKDSIIGYTLVGDFILARYLGGDETDFTNPLRYTIFGGNADS